MALSEVATSRTPVELRVRAEDGQLPVLRAVAEVIAVLTDFNLDHVSDIKLAVDEICTVLVKDSAADADLVCCFEFLGDELAVRIDIDTHTDTVPDPHSFGWHVLRTVTDSIATTHASRPEGGFRTTVEFTKSSRSGT